MDIRKVKEWLENKERQFEVLQRVQHEYPGPITMVKRLKDGVILHPSTRLLIKPGPLSTSAGMISELILEEFKEDMIHVDFVVLHAGGLAQFAGTCEIDDIDLLLTSVNRVVLGIKGHCITS